MKEIKNKKAHRGHNVLKVSGLMILVLLIMVSIAGATPSPYITFVTTGSSFSPIITVTGNPTIQWIFGDGSTSNSKSPTANFGSARTRTNTLVVTPWSAVTKINIGYDGSDEGVTPSSSTIANLKQQNVVYVSGLENVAPFLQIWASNNNPITALDFSNFTALNTIECFSCRSLATIELRNVPSLTRLCVEQSNISYLDLSEAPSLADLRGASQRSSIYTIY
jgi:Leucine-rich repeat (LRR) protein